MTEYEISLSSEEENDDEYFDAYEKAEKQLTFDDLVDYLKSLDPVEKTYILANCRVSARTLDLPYVYSCLVQKKAHEILGR
jgi:hypothetical protein